jgi:hypothetical protein
MTRQRACPARFVLDQNANAFLLYTYHACAIRLMVAGERVATCWQCGAFTREAHLPCGIVARALPGRGSAKKFTGLAHTRYHSNYSIGCSSPATRKP